MLYTVARLAVVLVVALGAGPSGAFVATPGLRPAAGALRSAAVCLSEAASPAAAATEDCGCEDGTVGVVAPTKFEGVVMNDVRVSGATLRATELVDARGARASVGSVIGDEGKAVVVFLRHLG